MVDVATNVEGAEVERLLGRTVMPRFHAGTAMTSGTLLTVLGGSLALAAVGIVSR